MKLDCNHGNWLTIIGARVVTIIATVCHFPVCTTHCGLPLTVAVFTSTVMRWEVSSEKELVYKMGVCTTVTIILCSASTVVLSEGTCEELEPKWLHPILPQCITFSKVHSMCALFRVTQCNLHTNHYLALPPGSLLSRGRECNLHTNHYLASPPGSLLLRGSDQGDKAN